MHRLYTKKRGKSPKIRASQGKSFQAHCRTWVQVRNLESDWPLPPPIVGDGFLDYFNLTSEAKIEKKLKLKYEEWSR